MCSSLLIHVHTAPDDAPLGFIASSVTANTIDLSWYPPPVESQNGKITAYKLIVIELETKEKGILKTSTTKATVENLHSFYTYNISVAAITIDIGPYSLPIMVKTLEDGKSLHLFLLYERLITSVVCPLLH